MGYLPSLIFLLFLSQSQSDYVPDEELVGYDCGSHQDKYEAYSLTEIGECNIPDKLDTVTHRIRAALVQANDFTSVHIRSCKVEVIRYVGKCHDGWYSNHQKIVDNGLARYMHEVEKFECKRAHEEGKMHLIRNLHVQDLKPNTTTDHVAMLAGKAGHNSTECTTTTYHDDFGSWNDVIVTATVKISIEDYEAPVHLGAGKVYLPSGVRCELGKEFCVDRDGAVLYWEAIKRGECAEQGYTVLFEGILNKTIEKDAEDSPLYSIDTPDRVFAFTHRGTYDVCLHKFIRTEHPKLFIVELRESETLKFSTKVISENLDIMSYVNSKFIYVEQRLRQQFNTLYRDVIEKRCNLERKILANTLSIAVQDPAEFAYRLKGRPGYIGIIAGEVIYVAKCHAVIVKPREPKDCYNEMPVSLNGKPKFLTPRTRIITDIGVKVVCDPKLPSIYNINGKYVKLLPIRELADPPTILTPEVETRFFTYIPSPYIIRAGIYTSEDAERIRERTMFPIERSAVINGVVAGMLGRGVPDGVDIRPFLKPEVIEGAFQDFLGTIWGKFQAFGTASAGIMMILLLAKIIKFGLDTVIHGIALHEIYGFSFHLLGALWDSLTQLLLHWGNQRENRKEGVWDPPKDPVFEEPSNEDTLDTAQPHFNTGSGHQDISTIQDAFADRYAQYAPRVSRHPSLLFDGNFIHAGRPIRNANSTSRGLIYPRLSRTNSQDLGTS